MPKPEWEPLDQGFHFHALELTGHQKIILRPTEQRIKKIVYPELVQQRAARRFKIKRGSKLGGKFKNQFTGMAARAWRQKRGKHC